MGNLSPRTGRTPSNRRKREQRAFTLTMVGGTAAAITVVGAILAILGVISGSIPLIAAIVAVVCVLWFRSTVTR